MIPASYNRYILSKIEKQKFDAILLVLAFIVSYIFYKTVLFGLCILFARKYFERLYENHLASKRKATLNLQFKDLLFSLSSSIATGRQMREALLEGRDNMKLIYSEGSIIVLELNYMVKRLMESKEAEDEVLYDFAKRSEIEDIMNFVDIYFTCRSTGGDLEMVVMKAANVIIEKIEIERDILTITAQKRFESKILTSIPLIIIVFLQLTSPEYLTSMYTTVAGRLIMTIALVGIVLSFYMSVKITEIQV